jgi:hypothetical protein
MPDEKHPFPFYDIALRGGFLAKNKPISGREWFGLNETAARRLEQATNKFVDETMRKGFK